MDKYINAVEFSRLEEEIQQLQVELEKYQTTSAYEQGQTNANAALVKRCKQLQTKLKRVDRRMAMLADTSKVEDLIKQLQAENKKYKTALKAISSANDSFATVQSCNQVADEALKGE